MNKKINHIDLLGMSYSCEPKDKYFINMLESYNSTILALAEYVYHADNVLVFEKWKAGMSVILGLNKIWQDLDATSKLKPSYPLRDERLMLIICNKDRIDAWKRKIKNHSTTKFKPVVVTHPEDLYVPALNPGAEADKSNTCFIIDWNKVIKVPEIRDGVYVGDKQCIDITTRRGFDVVIVDSAEKCKGAEKENPTKRGKIVCGNEKEGTLPIHTGKLIFIADIHKLFHKDDLLGVYPIIRASMPEVGFSRTKWINKFCLAEYQRCYNSDGVYLSEHKARDKYALYQVQCIMRENGMIRRPFKGLRIYWKDQLPEELWKGVFNVRKGMTNLIKSVCDDHEGAIATYDTKLPEWVIEDETAANN